VQLNHIYIVDISHRFYKLCIIKNFLMFTTHNTFWKLPVYIFRSIKTLTHPTTETGSIWNFVRCDNQYTNKCDKNQKMAWL